MKDLRPRLLLVGPPPGAGEDALANRSDDELMLLARGGAGAAFDTLVRRHQARVLGVAARRLGELSLAADVAQNAFVEVYRSLHRYEPRGKFPAFLYRVLLNQCRMQRRSARVEQRALGALGVIGEPGELDEHAILAREWQRDMEAAVLGLSEKLRDVVVLRYGADLKYEEIADVLGVPLGTVKRRLFDALAKLRVAMGSG